MSNSLVQHIFHELGINPGQIVLAVGGQVRTLDEGPQTIGGGSLGIFASSGALETAYPAVSNAGSSAAVGAAAPYTIYFSDGSAWGAMSAGGATNLSYTASTRVLASSTGSPATLPLFTSTDPGLAPLSGGGTSNFLRADGTWATPAASGSADFVGEYATAGALQTAWPAASNDGRTGTVLNALYKSDGVAWRALLTYEGGVVKAAGATLEAGYTQAQVRMLSGAENATLLASVTNLVTPRVLSRSSIPRIRPSSGSSNSTGSLTFNQAVTTTVPAGGIAVKIWLPANFVTGFGSAQLHDALLTSTTAAQLTGNPPTNPAGWVTLATEAILYACNVPGGILGTQGELDISHKETGANNTNNKVTGYKLGSTYMGGYTNAGVGYQSRIHKFNISCRGQNQLNKMGQWTAVGLSDNVATTDLFLYANVDTTYDSTLMITTTAPATESVMFEAIRVMVIPG